MRGRHTLSV